MYGKLVVFLSSIYSVDTEILKEYTSHWKKYHAPRKTIITAPEETEKYIYFILDGIQKSYYFDDGKQHVITFAHPPSFSGVLESFFTQTHSKYFLETITASDFLRLPFSVHEQLMAEHREIETLFRKATEKFLVGVIQRQHELMAFDVETRFELFMSRSAHLLNKVSQKDIASYLRIDATNFSKLLNQKRI